MASITTKSNISGRAAMLAKIKMAQIEKNKIHDAALGKMIPPTKEKKNAVTASDKTYVISGNVETKPLDEKQQQQQPQPLKELEKLTKEETIELLSTFSSLNTYTNYIKNNNIDIDGKVLSKLTSSKLIKKSTIIGKVGDAVERSLLAKEIRQLLTPNGEKKILKLRRSSSAEEIDSFAKMQSGDILNTNINWDNGIEARLSDDGATGVLFINNMADQSCYVIKAAENPEREIFANSLAIELDILTAKQRILLKKELVGIRRGLSKFCETTRSQVMENDLLKNEKGEIITTEHVNDNIMRVFFHLYKLNGIDFASLIELVNNSELLCNMRTKRAEQYLNIDTKIGVSNLERIGEIIVFDAFVNNNDRIPVVHSNVGNGRNIMFGNLGNDDNNNNNTVKQIIAIDQTISSFISVENDQPNSISSKLYQKYLKRVSTWLNACLHYDEKEVDKKENDSNEKNKIGKNGVDIINFLKEKYSINDNTLAEAICRVSGFEKGTAEIIANNSSILDYCKQRGSDAGEVGSLLCVRDFIVRNCGYDIGVKGLNLIRKSVCKSIHKIANKSMDDLQRIYNNVESMMIKTELNDTSVDMWKYLLKTNIRIGYLKDMLGLFKDAAM